MESKICAGVFEKQLYALSKLEKAFARILEIYVSKTHTMHTNSFFFFTLKHRTFTLVFYTYVIRHQRRNNY